MRHPKTSPPYSAALPSRRDDLGADRGALGERMAARARDRQLGDHVGGARGEQEHAVGKPDRLVEIVGDQKRGDAPARHQCGELVAQALGERVVERHEGLVEHQEVGLDREGAGERDAARLAERQLAGIVVAVRGEAERREQRVEIGVSRLRRAEPHVLFDRAPRQQARLLEHHAEPAVLRQAHGAGEIAVDPGDDAQKRRLAAAGRADQRRHRAVPEARTSGRGERRAARPMPTGRICFRSEHQAGRGRQRETCRSIGCTRKVSIASITRTKTIA